jgi:hypothetical protein
MKAKSFYKIIGGLFILNIFFLFSSCSSNENPAWKDAKIKVEVASRGVFQYLLEIDNALYFPQNLPANFQVPTAHGLEVRIVYTTVNNTKDIFIPNANDIPIYSYSVPIVKIIKIESK